MVRRTHWSRLPAATAILLLVSAPAALAQSDSATLLEGKFRAGDDVTIAAGETVADDVYIATGTAVIDGTVDGDVIVTAGQIDVGGTINGDLLAAGGTVTVDGAVQGDVRVTAGQVRVAGTVGEDAAVAAGTLTVLPSAEVTGDLGFTTGQTVVEGTVGGGVAGSTNEYDAAGRSGGTEDVSVTERRPSTVTERIWSAVRSWVSLVLVAALLLWLVPGLLQRGDEQLRTRPLPALAVGTAGLVGVPVVLMLAIVVTVLAAIVVGLVALTQLAGTVVATGLIIVAAAAATFGFFTVFVAHVIVSLALGGLLQRPRGRRDQLVAVAVGAIVLVLAFSVPVVGGFLRLLSVIVGLGAAVLAAWRARTSPAATPPEPTAAPQPDLTATPPA